VTGGSVSLGKEHDSQPIWSTRGGPDERMATGCAPVRFCRPKFRMPLNARPLQHYVVLCFCIVTATTPFTAHGVNDNGLYSEERTTRKCYVRFGSGEKKSDPLADHDLAGLGLKRNGTTDSLEALPH